MDNQTLSSELDIAKLDLSLILWPFEGGTLACSLLLILLLVIGLVLTNRIKFRLANLNLYMEQQEELSQLINKLLFISINRLRLQESLMDQLEILLVRLHGLLLERTPAYAQFGGADAQQDEMQASNEMPEVEELGPMTADL